MRRNDIAHETRRNLKSPGIWLRPFRKIADCANEIPERSEKIWAPKGCISAEPKTSIRERCGAPSQSCIFVHRSIARFHKDLWLSNVYDLICLHVMQLLGLPTGPLNLDE